MPHLIKIRKGWQNEYLAEYLLSKFCFVAKPSTIGEDVGTDFFCVLYEVIQNQFLQPKFSFAIQIKSNRKRIDISKNADYYADLEFPFFVGVMNQKKNKINIYSGEGITHFFTLIGNPTHKHNSKWYKPENKIYLDYYDSPIDRKELFTTNDNSFVIKLPYIGSLDGSSTDDKIIELKKELTRVSNLIQKNISGLKNGSYVYEYYSGEKVIYAGLTSVNTYKENFSLRLAEAFSNLKWKKNNGQNITSEFIFFEKVLLQLRQLYPNEPSVNVAYSVYNELKRR